MLNSEEGDEMNSFYGWYGQVPPYCDLSFHGPMTKELWLWEKLEGGKIEVDDLYTIGLGK